jgi:predicted dinucleotide-binding enzyme
MNITIIGASDTFARGLATWAIAAGHDVTIVGFNLGQAEILVRTINRAKAAGPSDPLLDSLIFMAMPSSCVLDARDFYGEQLDGKIVVDVTTPIHLETFEPIHPEAGSVAQEIAKALPRARVVKAFNPRFAGTLIPDENLLTFA